MANKKSNADIDYEDMSMEQLEEVIKQENAVIPPTQESVTQEEDVTAEEVVEEASGSEKEQPEAEETTVDEPDLVRGKSRKDIIKMWEDTQKMISRQGNEKHEMTKRLEALEKRSSTVEVKKDEFIEKLDNYNKEDISVIEKLVERKLEARSQQKKKETEAELQTNAESNEEFWSNLEAINPDLHSKIKEEVIGAIQKDKRGTLQTKGWLKTYVANYQNRKALKQKPDITSKKLKATTAGTGSTPQAQKKRVEDMTADEYAVHMNIPRE